MALRSPAINVMVRAAEKAAKGLRRDFGEVEQLQVSRKGLADFVSAADLKADRTLREELSRARPDYGLVTEEHPESPAADGRHRWIVDPLDGTTNFLHGIPHWAISIGLERDGEIVAAILDVIKNELYWAEKGAGAWLNDRRLRVSGRKRLEEALLATGLGFKGRDKGPDLLGQVAAATSETAGVRRFGSAALDLAWVASGRIDGFWERNPALGCRGRNRAGARSGRLCDRDRRPRPPRIGGLHPGGQRRPAPAADASPRGPGAPPRRGVRAPKSGRVVRPARHGLLSAPNAHCPQSDGSEAGEPAVMLKAAEMARSLGVLASSAPRRRRREGRARAARAEAARAQCPHRDHARGRRGALGRRALASIAFQPTGMELSEPAKRDLAAMAATLRARPAARVAVTACMGAGRRDHERTAHLPRPRLGGSRLPDWRGRARAHHRARARRAGGRRSARARRHPVAGAMKACGGAAEAV